VGACIVASIAAVHRPLAAVSLLHPASPSELGAICAAVASVAAAAAVATVAALAAAAASMDPALVYSACTVAGSTRAWACACARAYVCAGACA
jgi:hypothetical protein